MISTEEILKKLLIGRGISSIYCYQDFHLSLVHDKTPLGQPPNVRLQLHSDWIVNSERWWNGFLQKFPIDTRDMGYPYLPARAFALFMLIGSEIVNVEIDKGNLLTLHFSTGYNLLISGQNSIDEESWVIDANEDDRFYDFRITCNAQGILHISEGIKVAS